MAFGSTSIGSLSGAGQRPNATRLSFTAGDSVRAQVDVGSGNLLVTVRGVTLPGVNQQVQLGAYYNSAASDKTPIPRLGKGWGVDDTADVRLAGNSDNSVTYYAPSGLVGVFPLHSGSTTTYDAPAGFKDNLVKTSSGWTLTDHVSAEQIKFDTSGVLVSRTDKNSNVTTIAGSGSGSYPTDTITTPAGGAGGSYNNQAVVSTDTNAKTTIAQGVTQYGTLRSVSFARASNNATSFTDALGRVTTFGYDSTGLLTSIAAPGSVSTAFSYDSSRRVASITQTENSGNGPGNSVTRLSYASATQTLLAGPDTDQGSAITAVPNTTYTIDSSQRVTHVVDAAGRTQDKGYNANFDTTSTKLGSDTAASAAYTANSNESLTKTTAPTGSTESLSYNTTSGPAQYLPTGGTDAAGNGSVYHYTGAGNQDTSTNALAAKASVTYNSNGTVATATAPNNGTNSTGYAYTSKQLTQVTPVTGSSLGTRNYTYDNLGRLATATDGRGITTTYSYDANDKITKIAFSDGTQTSYGYDAAGRNNSRTDANGTTSYSYDQLGRLLTRQNTAGGGQMQYSYDKASNLVQTTTPAGGTTTYAFDDAGVPTKIVYPHAGGGTQTLLFGVDSQGRRVDTWLQANADHTTWAAHEHLTYDASGRITHLTADEGTGDASHTAVVDLSYCYNSGSTPPACGTTAANDREKLQFKKDNLSGATTTYTYDAAGRLKSANTSGGTNHAYTYNSNGNRLTADSQTLTYNPANQISTTGYTYDGAGNLTNDPSTGTTNIAYTAADQPKSVVNGGTTYTYTHAGVDNTEMLSQTTPSGTYSYAYGRTDQNGLPVVESVSLSSGATASITSDPVTGQPLMLRTNSGTQSLYIYDGGGSPVALITESGLQAFGYSYDPYGVPVLTQNSGGSGVGQNPYTFAGGVQDRTTGWIHYGNRYYNPLTGSFTQQDGNDTPLDPNNANRYAYAANDPINNTDPAGERSCGGAIALASLSTAVYFGGGAALILATGGLGIGLGAGLFAAGAASLPFAYQDASEACRKHHSSE